MVIIALTFCFLPFQNDLTQKKTTMSEITQLQPFYCMPTHLITEHSMPTLITVICIYLILEEPLITPIPDQCYVYHCYIYICMF